MRLSTQTCTLLACGATCVLAAVSIWWAPLNQDEGWYLMAAERVAQGALPYRDFFFTQPPVFPWVYQLARPLVAWQGLAGARGFTLLLSAGTLITLWTALRTRLPKHLVPLASLLLVCLMGLNPGLLQYSATVKSYALASFCLSLSLLFFLRSTSSTPILYGLSGILMALAIGTRLSLLPFALVFLIHLLRKKEGLCLYAAGGGITGLILFLPPLLLSPEELWFGLWTFHHGREVDGPILLRIAFLLRWFRSAFPTLLLTGLLTAKWQQLLPVSRAILISSLGTTLIHLFAPFPYDEYQVVLLPLLCWVAATETPRFLPQKPPAFTPLAVLCAALLFAGSSPAVETWFAGERDRLWWPIKERSDVSTLRRTARRLAELDPNGGFLITTDTYLAIEAGRDVPPGLEMGPFSFFPDLSTARADVLHVVNPERLDDILKHPQSTLLALSGYGFTLDNPGLTPTSAEQLENLDQTLRETFYLTDVVEGFGQDGTVLRIYVRIEADQHP
jgi:hypothetical protein